ncbi:MAG: DegT/DnrJ/EryC1/StrS family aminotransferase [Bacilli bacterium]|nr:DegT/DnrJ/EryC1/StrS family aminotransferase [Bacilli bacterium]
MRENNLKLGKELASYFNKKFGVITYSGTLAIEAALKILLNENANVLVSSEVCYSIINTILKLKMHPIIVKPKNNIYLTDEDINLTLKKYNIDCIMLVHQFGILNNLDLLKYKSLGIKVIEDVAQAWDIGSNSYKIGTFSDIVVTSFGKTKPLSNGIGGGLFFDEFKMIDNIDFCDNLSRKDDNLLLSYAYPLCEQINLKKLVSMANKIVLEQRNAARKYYELLENNDFIEYLDVSEEIQNTWHRFPIWIKDKKKFNQALKILEELNLEYQLPHEINLLELNKFKKCKKMCEEKKYFNIILLRTRSINLDIQANELRKLLIML